MGETQDVAAAFLQSLPIEEKVQLFNDLLAVEEVYHSNRNTTFYTFRKLRRASKRHFECRKRTFQYTNQQSHELVIQQIHEQHVFRNHYYFKVFFNMQEYSFQLVDDLLEILRTERVRYYTQPRMHFA